MRHICDDSGTYGSCAMRMFAQSRELRDALVASEPIRTVLAMVPKLDLALLSAIDLSSIIRAAVRARLCHVLITDEDTARALMTSATCI